MNLLQLRFLVAVQESDLNISTVARTLHSSPPAVGRQLKQLESELGIPLFQRNGRLLSDTTEGGVEIIARARTILREIHQIKRLSSDLRGAGGGTLSIATTHTQARYVLPPIIGRFREQYPKVQLHLH